MPTVNEALLGGVSTFNHSGAVHFESVWIHRPIVGLSASPDMTVRRTERQASTFPGVTGRSSGQILEEGREVGRVDHWL